MSNELKAAVERLRKAGMDGWMLAYPERPSFGHPSRQMEDWEIIAAAYLAEHPEDDDVLVTEEWVASLHPPRYWEAGAEYSWPSVSLCYAVEVPGNSLVCCQGFYIDGRISPIPLSHIKTRGDVRRLCRALGIELKELIK